LILIVL